jgi:RES domain-containing protein
MRVFRLCKSAFTKLDGEGAKLYGGRWNFIGSAMIYTSSHLSLSILELLVHTSIDLIPEDLISLEIEIPEHLSKTQQNIPKTWYLENDDTILKKIGATWLKEQKSAVLLVPSIIVPSENNVLLNPLHPDFTQIKLMRQDAFQMDVRLNKMRGFLRGG